MIDITDGNALVHLIAKREGWATEDDEYVRARIDDFINFPLDALCGSFFDDGTLWYAMYKQAGVLAIFDEWREDSGFHSFRRGVKYAMSALGLTTWTRDTIYAAVVGMAVHYSFTEAFFVMEHE